MIQYNNMKKLVFLLTFTIIISGCSLNLPNANQETDKSQTETNQEQIFENKYEQEGLGYSIQYPKTWVSEDAGKNTIVFSGPEGDESYLTIVKVQKLETKQNNGGYEDADQVITDLKMQAANSTENATFKEEKIYIYEGQNSLELEGRELLLEFTKNENRIKEWTIVIPGPKGDYLYYWAYNAPVDIYDKYLDVAQKMLKTLEIHNE